MFDTGVHNKRTLILMPSDRRGKVENGILLLIAARELGLEVESNCVTNNPFLIHL
jgi:uncharacterized 2Fe-2S/4Fe-4S cluster protein (DUF4445 family)